MDVNPYQSPSVSPPRKPSRLLWLRVVEITAWVLLFVLLTLNSVFNVMVKGVSTYSLVLVTLMLIVMTFGRRVYEKSRGRKRPSHMQGYYKQLEASFDDGKAFGGDRPSESRSGEETQRPE
jgi:hypothetical protein